jgi:hypothetical protein
MNSRDLMLGGQRIDFAPGLDVVDKMKAVMARVQKGEFGDPGKVLSELTGGLGRESAGMYTALGSIGLQPKRLQESEEMVRAAGRADVSYQTQQLATKQAVVSGSKGIAGSKAAAGAAEAALVSDEIGAEWGRVRKRMEDFKAKYGITTGFDWTSSLRDWRANMRQENPRDWERTEQERLLSGELTAHTPGAGAISGAAGAWTIGGGFARAGQEGPYPYANMDESTMLRQSVLRGAVSPEGGLTKVEQAALREVGINQPTLDRLNQMWLDSVKGLPEAFAAALAAVLPRPPEVTPAANALNP